MKITIWDLFLLEIQRFFTPLLILDIDYKKLDKINTEINILNNDFEVTIERAN